MLQEMCPMPVLFPLEEMAVKVKEEQSPTQITKSHAEQLNSF